MPRNIRSLYARASRMIGQGRLIDAVSRAADQHEATIAIAAIDIAMLVDLEKHPGMAERGTAGDVAGTVTGDTAMADAKGFGRGDHAAQIAAGRAAHNCPLLRRTKRGRCPALSRNSLPKHL